MPQVPNGQHEQSRRAGQTIMSSEVRTELRKEGTTEHASLVSTFPVVGIGNRVPSFRNEMRRPNFVHAAVCFTCWLRYFEPAGHIVTGPNDAARTGGLQDLV